MKRIFLIDYENVTDSGLEGLFSLTPEDCVYVFYTNKANRMSIELVSGLLKNGLSSGLEFLQTSTGKQALDFQLSSFLGGLIYRNDTGTEYVIISRDKGFDCLIPFWTSICSDVNIGRCDSISAWEKRSGRPAEQAETAASEPAAVSEPEPAAQVKTNTKSGSKASCPKDRTSLNSQVQQVLSKTKKYDNQTVNSIASLVTKNFGNSTMKKNVYQSILKQYGQKKGLEIYSIIKPLL